MKFLLTIVLCIFAFVAVSFAADCTVAGRGFNKGQKYSPPGQCIEHTCNGKGQISSLNCAYAPTPPGCKFVPENPKKRYPHCCSRNVC